MRRQSWQGLLALAVAAATLAGCGGEQTQDFDPGQPARGPGSLAGSEQPLNESFSGGEDAPPRAREVAMPDDGQPPDCDGECLAYCDSLGLQNPVNAGLCTSLWGVGLSHQPVDVHEACRRLFVDMVGRFPSYEEVRSTCEGRPWDDVVMRLMATEEFVLQNQIVWSDRFLYNNQNVSIERIYDMDVLVGKLYRGLVAYDAFAAVASAHPVVTRRLGTAGDRAEEVFQLFMGRPPLGSERSDLARLYTQWDNGYYDHPQLGMRLPDAVINFRCVGEDGEVEPGPCTSILYGYNELVLEPDIRARDGEMWSGLLRAEEWERLQMPGRLLSRDLAFWEKAVDDVLMQYLGYDLGTAVPEVRAELVRHLLAHDGDIRAVHHAVATSLAYLQSSAGATPRDFRWTYGPLKQADAETWLRSINQMMGHDMGDCDHRITRPGDLLEAGSIAAISLLNQSRWQLDDEGGVRDGFRDLARGLGGCPGNEVGGRFTTVSILTTATQLSHVADLCNPALEGDRPAAPIEALLPEGVQPNQAVTPQLGEQIVSAQIERFFGRPATAAEREEAQRNGKVCEDSRCRAEEFARPACFALLSSAEMLFY